MSSDLFRRHLGDQLPDRLAGCLASRSQTALTTAPVARCMAPLSGPIQRNWLSPVMCRQNLPGCFGMQSSSSAPPRDAVMRLDCSAADVVAAADGEGQAMAGQPFLSVSRMT
jgi:hypothetical protein